ncbi:Olfactory receptor 8J3 [Heterocephalus glaber]|uniref:Olfactory receptor 8J3 n=1 Tax=Heterocephalus glaber TaxID=10181 RepID=G5C8N1_HETGA|nr:Olfactory receptor 8J3 [Heterocephalus glaber]
MYFSLRHLTLINLGNSTIITLKMLSNFLAQKKAISYYASATQLGGFLVFIVAEIFMLATMAYDCYVAICSPLHYMTVVSPQVSLLLVSLTYLYGLFIAILPGTTHSLDTDKMASGLYTLVISMLNPMIYNLCNKKVRAALKSFVTNPCDSCKPM